jgi:hypothetical protein
MMVFAARPARVRRLFAAVRWTGAITAALALAALVAIGPPPGTAQAASGNSYNQITGEGLTASAVTVDWTSGLLNSDNQPISTAGSELNPNSDRSSETGSLSFMDNDFKNLQVTVSQTQNITHQAINVTWKGVTPTQISGGTAQRNFLQIMECYGDSSTGPSPEDCEYGSAGMLGSGSVFNSQIGTRTGVLCPAGSVPNPDNPPGPSQTGLEAGDAGCDPYEPTSENPPHCWPNAPAGDACSDGQFDVPFVPVDGSGPIYDQTKLGVYFSELDTNEVQEAITGANQTGEVDFQAQTETQSQGLGCGETDNGQPRGCWLVVVPRGGYEPNGFDTYKYFGNQEQYLYTSPLSAANWAQRIQIHLNYAPLQVSCSNNPPIYSMEGTQLITKAVSSWQLALNRDANCALIYQYGEQIETQTTTDLSTGAVGLGFTTIPIGSEASRYPGQPPPPTLPNILYAPVAVTGIGLGFNINDGLGFTTTAVNLTPSLMAKALTQAYRSDLPDYGGSADQHETGPAWSLKNPINITGDPAFQKINSPTVIKPIPVVAQPLEPLTTLDHSEENQQLWQWVQSDPATVSWLDGKDPSNPVAADPSYTKFNLGKPPAVDDYPQDYTVQITCTQAQLQCGQNGGAVFSTPDLLPQFFDFDAAASDVLAANDKSELIGSWNTTATNPSDGLPGVWNSVGAEPPGQTFMWTVADLSDVAHYGLIDADLCNPAGTGCVGPSVASLTKTLDSAATDKQGLVEVNPAKVAAGGYPLVDVVYAAVPTNQKVANLTAYANLIKYAVTEGQTAGSALGDLPPGYLPLTKMLQDDALSVVGKLLALTNPQPSHSTTATHTATSSQSGSPTRSGTTPPTGSTTTSSPNPTVGASAAPTSTQSCTSTSATTDTVSPRAAASATATATATPANTQTCAGTAATSSPSQQGPVYLAPSAELAGGTTPRQSTGAIRWALIAVLIIGAAGALGGTVLRSGRITRWLIRGRSSAR